MDPVLTRRSFLKGVGLGIGALSMPNLLGGLTGCTPDMDALLLGREMVGGVTGTRAAISLVGGEFCLPSTRFRLSYGTVSGEQTGVYPQQAGEIAGAGQHDPITFALQDLAPDTRYYYRVDYDAGDGWRPQQERSFHTRRSPGRGFRFCIATDTHVNPVDTSTARHRRVYENISRDNPDILITLGDDAALAYQSHQIYPWPDPERILGTLGTLRACLDQACHSAFYLPVPGNHEGLFGWTTDRPEYASIVDARLRYLPVPGADTFPEGGDPLGRYGAFVWGDALFVWLDPVGFCQADPRLANDPGLYVLGDAQRAFLEQTLEAHAAVPWKFVLSHEVFGGTPACSSDSYGRGNANAAHLHQQAAIQDLMVRYGAQAFFYGHDHVFSVSEADGVSYVCSGHAGATPPTGWVDTLRACYEPWLLFPLDETNTPPAGHVRVDVTPEEVTVAYVVASSMSEKNGTVAASYVMRL